MLINTPYIFTCAISVLILLGIMIYTRIKGPNSWMANISFWVPVIATIVLLVLVFYTDSFWWALLINVVTLLGIQIVGFMAMENALEDKTGIGVTMFSGFLAIYGMGVVLIVKLIISIW
ncbi:MAG: hypothetical protein U0U66_05245 [Cytophagaceae bacterium]